MATFFIKHITKYSYSKPVIDGATLIRLHPINDEFQKVVSHLISVTNNPFVETFTDFFGNRVGTFMVTEPHDELSIESEIEVITTPKLFPDDNANPKAQWELLNATVNNPDYIDFLKHKPFSGSRDVLKLIDGIDKASKPPYQLVLDLCNYVYTTFKYVQGITQVDTTLDEVWNLKAGVCQDFTNVFLQMVKMAGIPARYVSGYICPNDIITRGEGATHAWIEAYIPNYGWFGVDPTNNAMANENHVRLAVGRNYNDCSPVKGGFKGKVEADLVVKVEVNTTKSKAILVEPANVFATNETNNNSYQRNLERVQQQQQQQ